VERLARLSRLTHLDLRRAPARSLVCSWTYSLSLALAPRLPALQSLALALPPLYHPASAAAAAAVSQVRQCSTCSRMHHGPLGHAGEHTSGVMRRGGSTR
jgi:hypothetical protein